MAAKHLLLNAGSERSWVNGGTSISVTKNFSKNNYYCSLVLDTDITGSDAVIQSSWYVDEYSLGDSGLTTDELIVRKKYVYLPPMYYKFVITSYTTSGAGIIQKLSFNNQWGSWSQDILPLLSFTGDGLTGSCYISYVLYLANSPSDADIVQQHNITLSSTRS